MRLLIYSHYFAPSIGGVESIVLSLAGSLAGLRTPENAREFEVVVATQTPANGYPDAALPFPVVRRPGIRRLWRLIRDSDVIHLAGPSLAPLLLAWLSRRPFVLEHHGYQAICPNGLLMHQPDRSICPNHFLRKDYAKCYRCLTAEFSPLQGMQMLLFMFPRYFLARRASANLAITQHVLTRSALPRSAVSYYGIEDPFQGVPPAGEQANAGNETGAPGSSAGVVRFAFVGRLVSEKGLPVLLEAVRILKQSGHAFEVRLLGDGPERPHLEAIIRRDGLESLVQITGFLTGPALTAMLRDVAVVVMPSIWEETAGLAAIEQMMRGRPVIVSDVGGLAEVVGDAGMKFPLGNAPALAEAMQKVLADPGLVKVLGARARARALAVFPIQAMIAAHARAYRQLAARSNENSNA